MQKERVRKLNQHQYQNGPIVYWMNREQRVNDNWALLYAQQLAEEHKTSLVVLFNFIPDFLGGGLRQSQFKIENLKAIEKNLRDKNIPSFITVDSAKESAASIQKLLKKIKAGAIVTDFYPLKIAQEWQKNILQNITLPFYEVDAHNIVPCFIASNKKEFGAYTLRPKIHKLLPKFLDEFPEVKKQKSDFKIQPVDWDHLQKKMKIDTTIKPVDWIKSGEKNAFRSLQDFLENKLFTYDEKRNDPNADALSNLSPYLHYGQLSAQRIALEAQKHDQNIQSQEAFLEELIVRKELADNFCFYEPNYDNFAGFPAWAQKTLNEHRDDPREKLYSLEEFEQGKTHDKLWNASQMEMVKTGKMHGYMRMYWAKKILEWTASPEEAQKIAIYLNDKYELDGRDPNGYAGIAWAIGGVHDRAWFSRPILGKIRYMSFNGAKSKFDVGKYIEKVGGLNTQTHL